MGQYHFVVNLDKHEYIHPHEMGDGLKLMEFGNGGGCGTMTALAVLLAAACKGGPRGGGDVHSEDPIVGSWAGDRIAIVGDYASPGDLPEEFSADLIFDACQAPEWRDEHLARLKGDAEQFGKAARFEAMPTFTDITPRIRQVLADAEYTYYYGTGWLDREHCYESLGYQTERGKELAKRDDLVAYPGKTE